MKAVLHCRDSNLRLLTSHDICCISSAVQDDQINKDAGKLYDVTSYHTRMRYPDLFNFPKIPSDMYSKSNAEDAYRSAENILKRAETLVS